MKIRSMKIFTLPLRATKSACLFVLLVFAGHFSKAQTNYAIDLNGTDAYADLGNVSPTDNFTNGLTIECWVKWDAFNSWSRLADLGNGAANNNIIFANEATSSKLRFEVYQNGTTQGITS